jgi:hypothetical protein
MREGQVELSFDLECVQAAMSHVTELSQVHGQNLIAKYKEIFFLLFQNDKARKAFAVKTMFPQFTGKRPDDKTILWNTYSYLRNVYATISSQPYNDEQLAFGIQQAVTSDMYAASLDLYIRFLEKDPSFPKKELASLMQELARVCEFCADICYDLGCDYSKKGEYMLAVKYFNIAEQRYNDAYVLQRECANPLENDKLLELDKSRLLALEQNAKMLYMAWKRAPNNEWLQLYAKKHNESLLAPYGRENNPYMMAQDRLKVVTRLYEITKEPFYGTAIEHIRSELKQQKRQEARADGKKKHEIDKTSAAESSRSSGLSDMDSRKKACMGREKTGVSDEGGRFFAGAAGAPAETAGAAAEAVASDAKSVEASAPAVAPATRGL